MGRHRVWGRFAPNRASPMGGKVVVEIPPGHAIIVRETQPIEKHSRPWECPRRASMRLGFPGTRKLDYGVLLRFASVGVIAIGWPENGKLGFDAHVSWECALAGSVGQTPNRIYQLQAERS